jgi:hypothetical protein
MPTTIGQHTVATFTSPVNGTTPIDANTVRGNDNTIRSSYNNHDTDPGIHLQSSTFSARPAAGTAGRKWVTADAGSYKLWYDDGTRWHEVGNDHIEVEVLADENLVKGDVVEISGYNVGLNLPRVQKTTSAGPAFAIVNETIANGSRGYVINTGIIFGFDTTNYGTSVEPSILYTATGGTLTSTKPVSGTYQASAFLLRHNSSNGVLFVEFSAPAIVERSDNTASTVVLRDGSGNFSAGTVTANLIGNVTGNITGNADTATKLSSNRTFALTGNVTGSVSSDLTAGFSIASTIANDVITNAMISPTAAIAYSKLALTNSIVDADIAAAAAIADTKLATIATAGKVANSATTATSSNTNNAIVARDGSGNFSAGTISAALSGNVTSSNATITGGSINGTAIGGTTPAAGTFSTLSSANVSLTGGSINGTPIGGTTASTGAFTNLSYTGTLTGGTGVVNLGSGQLVKDASGNVGIGVTPSAWGGNAKALQITQGPSTGALASVLSSDEIFLLRNARYDGSDFRYVSAGTATSYQQASDASHRWGNAPTGTAGNAITFEERMRIDSAGNVGIGTTSPLSLFHTDSQGTNNNPYVGISTITGTSSTEVNPGGGSTNNYDDTKPSFGITFRRRFTLDRQTNLAGIYAYGSAVWRGGMVLRTKAGTSQTGEPNVDAIVLTPNGHAIIPSGVMLGSFSGTFNQSQVLDDYEEGTWTPTDGSGAGLTFSNTSGNCFYTKIGRTVIATFRITYPSTANASTVLISGLPFTVLASTNNVQAGFFSQHNFTPGLMIQAVQSSTNMLFIETDASTAFVPTNADVSGKNFHGTVVYQT